MVLGEWFHTLYHGKDKNSDPKLNGHFLVNSIYHSFHLVEHDDGSCLLINDKVSLFNMLIDYRKHIRERQQQHREIHKHTIIKNYVNMSTKKDYIKPEIAELVYLSGGECVAILKTFWLRIIQRTWKRIYKERKTVNKYSGHSKKIRGHLKGDSTQHQLPIICGMMAQYK